MPSISSSPQEEVGQSHLSRSKWLVPCVSIQLTLSQIFSSDTQIRKLPCSGRRIAKNTSLYEMINDLRAALRGSLLPRVPIALAACCDVFARSASSLGR